MGLGKYLNAGSKMYLLGGRGDKVFIILITPLGVLREYLYIYSGTNDV